MKLAVVGVGAGSCECAREDRAGLHRAAPERPAVRRNRLRHARSVGPDYSVPYGDIYL